ncbi:MAG TPA: DUF2089 domain-containing protein [Chloroflexota bacterium]|nr:DUF2089 domain-containing protein [Chloroflexota bacterium]
MTRKILEHCPSCGGPLLITEVRCTRCATQVRAHYRPCDFCGLSEEQSTFLRLFLTSRGNLSEVEKRLGVSYPTVRAKLDEVIARVSAVEAGEPPRPPHNRRALLDAVARGEISPAEAAGRLKEIGEG